MAAVTRRNNPNLGSLSARRFLQDYWQKKPLLIRRAFGNFEPLVSLTELATLARRDDVEARLVTFFEGRWGVRDGPFARLPARRSDWTLLVQGVNLYVPAVDALLQRFAFLPYTRLDDIMVSYAVEGGSVGPHFDSYDVFLLQAEGRRRWRIGSQKDLELEDDVPLKILRRFAATEEWVLEPGDMLYLPPHIAHEGVALEPGMTYSIGFRAPSFTEIAREFLFSMAETTSLEGRYQDASRKPVARPARLERELLRQVGAQLGRIRWSPKDVEHFVGRYFSEPKAHVYFEPPAHRTRERFGALALRHGLIVDPRTRLLYRNRDFYINGECVRVSKSAHDWLATLADQRRANRAACRAGLLHDELLTLLHEWYEAGWIIKGESTRVAQ